MNSLTCRPSASLWGCKRLNYNFSLPILFLIKFYYKLHLPVTSNLMLQDGFPLMQSTYSPWSDFLQLEITSDAFSFISIVLLKSVVFFPICPQITFSPVSFFHNTCKFDLFLNPFSGKLQGSVIPSPSWTLIKPKHRIAVQLHICIKNDVWVLKCSTKSWEN